MYHTSNLLLDWALISLGVDLFARMLGLDTILRDK